MLNLYNSLIASTNLNPWFLIDGTGALISAALLGVVLVIFETHFGMPRHVLFTLAVPPIIFACIDFYVFLFVKVKLYKPLILIALLNIGYCILSLTVIIVHNDTLTDLGWAYFIGEIVIVMMLAVVELRLAFTNKTKQH